MKRYFPFVLLVTFSSLLWGSDEVAVPGIVNFHQVDEHVFRGGQPAADGFRSLAKMGVKTVVDLRHDGERAEEKLVKAAGMNYVSIPMSGLTAPTTQQMKQLMAILNDAANPVFLHCKHGADRTGTIIACYRIRNEHWTNQKALEEAKLLGMSPLQHPRSQYILGYN
jgi:uncharacterized protein (TIGR01244 family)